MRWLATLLLLLALAAPAKAQEDAAAAIEEVIAGQVEAFRHDDWAGAFGFASPGIQGIFGTPERFREMVLGGYSVVTDPAQMDFGRLRPDNLGQLGQEVIFTDGAGQRTRALYLMQRQPDGSWRINGVYLEALSDLTI